MESENYWDATLLKRQIPDGGTQTDWTVVQIYILSLDNNADLLDRAKVFVKSSGSWTLCDTHPYVDTDSPTTGYWARILCGTNGIGIVGNEVRIKQ